MAFRIILCLYSVALVHFTSSQENIPSSDGGTGLSQIDLEADKDVTICTKQKKPLSCAYPGSNIAITNVFWGRRSADICPSDDGDTVLNCDTAPETLGIVKAKCEGKEACDLEARHALLQNPKTSHCPGVNKYLIINYTCVPDAKEVVLCDSENATLTCPATWKIGVNSVFWGRQSTSVCPAENGQTTCTGAPESLGIVKKSCDGLTRCDVHASYDQVQNGAENCPGVGKYLIINYSCKPHPNIETEDDFEVKQPDSIDQDKQVDKPVKPEAEPAKHDEQQESVAKALKQLDGDPKSTVDNPPEGKEDLNIGRLGMGGLKALEKINNLIKASAEAQGGDESMIENGLTDDQAQTIERMIIEGIKNIKNKTSAGTRKASIPRKIVEHKPQSVVKSGQTEVKDNTRSNVNTAAGGELKQKVKSTLYRLDSGNTKPSTIKGLKRRIMEAPATRNLHLNANEGSRNVPVMRNTQQKRQPQSPLVNNLGVGNAGAGNQL